MTNSSTMKNRIEIKWQKEIQSQMEKEHTLFKNATEQCSMKIHLVSIVPSQNFQCYYRGKSKQNVKCINGI